MIPEIGSMVIYHDEVNRPHDALVTAVHYTSPTDDGCINLLHVLKDESRQDQYGRQIERVSSVMHVSKQGVAGRYWRRASEAPLTRG